MWPHTKSFAIGAISSIATLFLSTIALASISAFVMPASMPLVAWEWIVVLGLGATLTALTVQFIALATFKATAWPASIGFISSLVVALLVSGLLPSSLKTLIAWAIGALSASLLARMRSNNSFKPSPHQDGPAQFRR